MNKIEGQAILFHPDTDDLFYLNDTALDVVEILSQNPITLNELLNNMLEIYDVPIEELSNDINDLIKELEKNKFLEIN